MASDILKNIKNCADYHFPGIEAKKDKIMEDIMKVFEKSSWIWLSKGSTPDQYAEFTDTLVFTDKKTVMNLSCDSDYTLWINGAYVSSSQYGDFEHYKIYDTIDLTPYLVKGNNRVDILVHYFGVDSSRYRKADAGLIYEVICENEVVLASREEVLSRLSPTFESGNMKLITHQLGFSFTYNAAKETDGGYTASSNVHKTCEFFPRPIKKASVYDKKPMKHVKAFGDRHFLVDLGGESVGFPTIELFSETEQTVTVAYGEHTKDGGVRRRIAARDFSFVYKTKKGENKFTDYMLRLGCRFLEVFAEEPIRLDYVGVRPQVYETSLAPYEIKGELEKRIYEVSVNTLNMCMFEHYVDCPWREQALYTFDSRNQMLCGYYAFSDLNAEYVRANLKLISKDTREDGLLSICFPAGSKTVIPSFALYYMLEMKEYLMYTGDKTLAREALSRMREVIDECLANTSNGLIKKFEGDNMWNFYDWRPFCEGTLGKGEKAEPDLAINCIFLLALDSLEYIYNELGEDFPYVGIGASIRKRVREEFMLDSGVFTMRRGKDELTVLGNTLAILTNVVTPEEASLLCDKLIDGSLVESTLSMKILVYEALLNENTDKYKDFILNEIKKNYTLMLSSGSDTFWETILGDADFDNAGSLCHGWSAVPIYIYHRLGIAKKL